MIKEGYLIALAYAAEHNDVNEVTELVKSGGKELLRTRMPSAYLGTILHFCITWASLETLAYLQKFHRGDVDVCICDKVGDTALHNLPNWPTTRDVDKCLTPVNILLDLSGANLKKLLAVQNSYGQMTALCKALVYDKEAVCIALLDAAKQKENEENLKTGKAVANHVSSDHWLTLRARGWLVAKAYGLGAKGFDHSTSNYIDRVFCTALHLAALRKLPDVVLKILRYNDPGPADSDLTICVDHDGNSPLHVAAKVGNADICELFLKYGVDRGGVNSVNNEGETPLHIASANGHAILCEKLLDYGASVAQADHHGRYALTNAFARGDSIDAVKKLLEACIPLASRAAPGTSDQQSFSNPNPKESFINAQLGSDLTPLHVAVAISSEHHITNLISAGA